MRQQATNFGTRVVTDDVVEVDFAGHPFQLTASEGETYEALAVIVATGARANYLGLPSEEKFKNRGVSACAVCDGALPRFRNKPLAVVGGGDSAVEEADYLSKFASTVYMVHRRDELRASKIMAQRAMENPKIEILWNRTVDEVLGNDSEGVTGVRLTSTVGEADLELPVAGFFLAIGHTPNTAFLGRQAGADREEVRQVDDALPHLHQRRGRLRRRRRRRRLLPPGRHRRRQRLHGRAGRRTLAGGAGVEKGVRTIFCRVRRRVHGRPRPEVV